MIKLPNEYTVDSPQLNMDYRVVLRSWYTDTHVKLILKDGLSFVPLVDEYKTLEIMQMYPRFFLWLQAVFKEKVTPRHIATLLMYASLGQPYPKHYFRSAEINPDLVYVWDKTGNEQLFLSLHRLFSMTPRSCIREFPTVNVEKHAAQYTRKGDVTDFNDWDGDPDEEDEEEDDD